MKKLALVTSALLVLAAASCSALPVAGSAAASYADPFAYCAAVGTIDSPDARYTGPTVPDTVIQGYKTAAGLSGSTEPQDMFKKSTIWRCMGGKVYACNFGANLPCDSKARTDRTPSQAMNDYCKANPGTDFMPMAVTGHDTIYGWRCEGTTATAAQQIAHVDAAGYISEIWYAITPQP